MSWCIDRVWPLGSLVCAWFSPDFHLISITLTGSPSQQCRFCCPWPLHWTFPASQGGPLEPNGTTLGPLTSPMAPLWVPWPLKTVDFPYVFHTFCEIQHLAKKSSKVSPSEPNGTQSCPQVTPMAPKVCPKWPPSDLNGTQSHPKGLPVEPQSLHFELLLAVLARLIPHRAPKQVPSRSRDL